MARRGARFCARLAPQRSDPRTKAMTESDANENVFADDVCDEALEAAGTTPFGMPTLMHASYCFTCGTDVTRN